MEFLHTMVRISDLDESLDFYCNKLGLIEFSRKDNEKGRFTLIFLCAPEDKILAEESKKPLIESNTVSSIIFDSSLDKLLFDLILFIISAFV